MKVMSIGLAAAVVFCTAVTIWAQRPNSGDKYQSQFIKRYMVYDKNGDGKITKQEAPEQLKRLFDQFDSNSDDVIEKAELKVVSQRIRARRPGQRRPSQGRPGQRRPGQGRPGQGRPGQGRPGQGQTRAGDIAKEGRKAPDFKLKTLDGKQEVTLSSFAGKKPVIIFFGSYT